MALSELVEINAYEYSKNKISPVKIPISAEYPFQLNINNSPVVSIACSGDGLEDLAFGYLVSEGIIKNKSEIKNIEIDEKNLKINITTEVNEEILERLFRIHSIASGCGHGRMSGYDSESLIHINFPGVKPSIILSTMKNFLSSSEIHKKTRGVHSALLLSVTGEKIIFVDEIGRHNAVDKIIGYTYNKNISLHDKMIYSTGRVSSEIIFKAINAGLPVVISKAAPTSFAVELAKKYNLILIAKVRSNSFCIFNGKDKILLD